MHKLMFSLNGELMRIKKDGHRKPLRLFKEMAEEFGVSSGLLKITILKNNGPKPVLNHTNASPGNKNTWYDPIEMRKWWASLKETK